MRCLPGESSGAILLTLFIADYVMTLHACIDLSGLSFDVLGALTTSGGTLLIPKRWKLADFIGKPPIRWRAM